MSHYLLILHDAKDGSQAGRAELQECISTTLRLGEHKAQEIFESLPAILCQGLTKPDAERFARVLERFGAVVEIMAAPDTGLEVSSSFRFGGVSLESSAGPPVNSPETMPVSRSHDDFSLELEPEEALLDSSRSGSLQTLFSDDQPLEEASHGSLLDVSTPATEVGDAVAVDPSGNVEISPAILHRAFAQLGEQERTMFDDDVEPAAPSVMFPAAPARPNRRSGTTLLCLAAFALALCLGFPLLASHHDDVHITIDVARLLAEQASILGIPGATRGDAKLQLWKGSADEAETHSAVDLFMSESGANSARLLITRDEPHLLSIDELAKGAPLPIWLSRIDGVLARLENQRELPFAVPADTEILRGALRAYIGDAKGNDRIVLRGTMAILPAVPGEQTRRVLWDVRSAGMDLNIHAPYLARSAGKLGFSVVLQGSINVQLADPNTSLVPGRPTTGGSGAAS